jgi:hypothetical protein
MPKALVVVVPANAGAHTPRRCNSALGPDDFLKTGIGGSVHAFAGSAKQESVDCFVASAFARRRASADRSAPLRKRFAFVAGNDVKIQLRDLAA